MGKEKYEKAICHFKKALDKKPDYAPAMNNLGNAYFAQKRWDSAIEYYTKATDSAIYATPYKALSNLGGVYYEKKDYKRSEQYYLKALDIKPDFVYALRGIARTYIAQDRLQEAIVKLEKALTIAPDQPLLYHDLGKAYQLSGDYKKARHAYEKVIELAPDSPVAGEDDKGHRGPLLPAHH